jgi:hypothetical protein
MTVARAIPSRPEIRPIEMTGTMGRKSSTIRVGTLPAESEFIRRNSLKTQIPTLRLIISEAAWLFFDHFACAPLSH